MTALDAFLILLGYVLGLLTYCLMPYQIRQHIPDFCSGFEPDNATVDSIEDLDRVEWIHAWRFDAGFWQFAWAREPGPKGRTLLMAEFDSGEKWYVVGYLSDVIPELPRALFETKGAKSYNVTHN